MTLTDWTLIYSIGVIFSIIAVFLLNRYGGESNSVSGTLSIVWLSWVIIAVIVVTTALNSNIATNFNKWFQRGGR